MKNFNLFTKALLRKTLNYRKNETKFGEHIRLLSNLTNIYDDIKQLDVDYVIFGISEDIGVVANYGISGTYSAWSCTIKKLLNTQNNAFINAKRVLILGNLEYTEFRRELDNNKINNEKRTKLARGYTKKIDEDVTKIVNAIVRSGKTPIIIGGGHNNSYGNLKGTSLAINRQVNAINLDAHHDFRIMEGRHSGNGFSYANTEGYLKKYYVLGLHENYISQNDIDRLKTTKDVEFSTYESIEVRNETTFNKEIIRGLKHVSSSSFGIEIDCDCIENINSSAMTPSGFSRKQVRQFVHTAGKEKHATYLHICEASPILDDDSQIGKLITYLITDFIKAHASRNN